MFALYVVVHRNGKRETALLSRGDEPELTTRALGLTQSPQLLRDIPDVRLVQVRDIRNNQLVFSVVL